MKLPKLPGVYIMKNRSGGIIYIGKAKNLKNRVSTYFGSGPHDVKVMKMVENAFDFDYIVVDSEYEAFVLESSLIKQHQPKYNIKLKDDKGFYFIKVTAGDYPVISVAHKKENDGAQYIGPYTTSFYVNRLVGETNKIFRLPQCSKVFPRDIGKGRPCLNYFIARCSAVCARKIGKQDYGEAHNGAMKFIRNGSADTLKKLKAEMEEAAENLQFEKAARIRDRIESIQKTGDRQKVVTDKIKSADVFSFVKSDSHICFAVLRFDNYRLYDSEHFIISEPVDDEKTALEQFLARYYAIRELPPKIILQSDIPDKNLLIEYFGREKGNRPVITVPVKGELEKVIGMCKNNAAEKLCLFLGKNKKEQAALIELKELLGLETVPAYIESYDISHTAGSENVCGMAVFRDGAPYKKAYKRFAIKGFEGQDDYGSLKEAASRRFAEYEKTETDEGFGKLPDLILVDGGQGQVSAFASALDGFSLEIPVFGMVKDGKHKTRAVASSGGEIEITSKRSAFTLIGEIQNEVHRFSVEYHRKKHEKNALRPELCNIEGIGEKKAKILLDHFKTVKAIKSASFEELSAVKGISETNAEKIFLYFRK